MDNQGREKNKVSGKGTVQRRGEGLGTGKVGNSNAGKVIGTVMKTAHKGGGGQVSPRTVRSVSRMGGALCCYMLNSRLESAFSSNVGWGKLCRM